MSADPSRDPVHPDRYYGRYAKGYEKRRLQQPSWHREQEIVESIVRSGPVIDVPCGTGRFFRHYAAHGIHAMGVDLSRDMLAEARKVAPADRLKHGSIYALPFGDQSFEYAVCVRFMHWTNREQFREAVKELRRVARQLVFTARVGPEGVADGETTYTQDPDVVQEALSGMRIDRHMISRTRLGDYMVIHGRVE